MHGIANGHGTKPLTFLGNRKKLKERAQLAGQDISQYVERLLKDDLAVSSVTTGLRHSIWDVFGKAPEPRSTAEIDAIIRGERASWDDR